MSNLKSELEKIKIGDIVIFDLMGISRRKGKIIGFQKCGKLGTLALTKKYGIPLCRIRRIFK